ncbi:MAG: AIM24 family protein [Thermoplasmata archaeon]|nr:AIM24 family protein [Thermoplasmata archaeon]
MKFTVQGGYIPNALTELGPDEQVYCEAGVMVYCDPTIRFHQRAMIQGGIGRSLKRSLIGGVPFYMHTYLGPGYAAFSRSEPGEVRVIELAAGQILDVAEHSLLLASSTIQYDTVYVKGTGRIGRMIGFWMDRLAGPGTVAVHGHGNILSFNLPAGEVFDVDHGAVLMKDDSVTMQAFNQSLGGGLMGSAMSYEAMRISGPGHLWLQTLDPSLPRR